MPNYNNSVIYKLLKKDDFDNLNIYIGSSCNFRNRKCRHKFNTNSEKSKNYYMDLYTYIRNNGGFDEWTMIQIENFKCNTKKELEARERYWVELLKPKLNSRVPNRTLNECRLDNIERYKKKKREYYEKNKKEINEKGKIYRENNKEKLTEKKKLYYENNKEEIAEKGKIYRENNKEKIAEREKKWRENNREEINRRKRERAAVKVTCECGCIVRTDNLTEHKKTQKHFDTLKNLI